MALNLNKNLKLYYSIKEVAEMFDLNESTLRYWEQEFPSLKPREYAPLLGAGVSVAEAEDFGISEDPPVSGKGYRTDTPDSQPREGARLQDRICA